jgi:hypothetical protein
MGGSRRVPLPGTRATRAKSKTATRGRTSTPATAVKAATAKVPSARRRTAARGVTTAKAAATYVYCVVRGAKRPAVASRVEPLPGGGAPRVLPLAPNTWLVVANVPLKAFGQAALDKRLQDVDWMSRCGVAHQAVMDSFLDSDAVVPMTLFTIFANDERALAEARKDPARLEDTLDRVAGRAEWVVRVLRGDAAPSAAAAEASAPTGAAPRSRSGREFLQAKVDQRQAARRAAEETGQAVRTLMSALADAADDVNDRTEARTAGALGSAALLDAAFLVMRTSERQFEQVARRMAQPLIDRGFRVSVTGPWPCYSFVASESSS